MKSMPASQLAKLVREAQAGQAESFGAIFDAFFDQIFHYVAFRVEPENSEDLVGEVFLKAWKSLASYRPQSGVSFLAWLYQIAHNQVIDHYRKKREILESDIKNSENFFTQIADNQEPRPDQSAEARLQHAHLHKALAQLGGLHREVLELKFLAGLSNREIATVLGRTEGNVRVLQLRALQAIRQFFVEE